MRSERRELVIHQVMFSYYCDISERDDMEDVKPDATLSFCVHWMTEMEYVCYSMKKGPSLTRDIEVVYGT